MKSYFFISLYMARGFFQERYTKFFGYKNKFTLVIILLLLPIASPLLSLPVENLLDRKYYSFILIEESTYKRIPPRSVQGTIYPVERNSSGLKLLVPQKVLSLWKDKEIPFQVLPYPRGFSEIDRSIRDRENAGCVSATEMLSGYKTPRLNEIYLDCLEKEYPTMLKKFVIGQSVRKQNISALRIRVPDPWSSKIGRKKSTDRHKVFFHCSIHGNELIAIEHCYDIILEIIKNPSQIPSAYKTEIWVVPILNPDGVDDFWYKGMDWGRVNANHVDLNRNFPYLWDSGIERASSGDPRSFNYRGSGPGSEPEVRAVLDLFEKQRFLFSLSIHCYANSVLIPYTIPGTKNPDPNLLQSIGESLAVGVESIREGRDFEVKKNLYAVDGTDQDSFFHYYGAFAYLFETSHLLERYDKVAQVLENHRRVFRNFLESADKSAKWKILVLDEYGNPTQAEVQSNAYIYYANERRVTNQDGIFNQVVPSGKVIQARIKKKGYKTKVLKIIPSADPIRHRIQLTPNNN